MNLLAESSELAALARDFNSFHSNPGGKNRDAFADTIVDLGSMDLAAS